MSRYLTVEKVADALRVSASWVYKHKQLLGGASHLAESLRKGDRVMVVGRLRQRSWKTPTVSGARVAEIEADDVGASLKWATVHVERATTRSGA